jgi:NADPH-dependent curcumin reductase CurA
MDSNIATNPHHNDMTNNNLASVSITTLNSDSVLMTRIAEEGLRQTQQTFNMTRQSFILALVMTGASAIVGFVGVGFLLSGKASEGTITTAGGLVSSMVFVQLAKDASDRLDKANERLDKIAAKVKDED